MFLKSYNKINQNTNFYSNNILLENIIYFMIFNILLIDIVGGYILSNGGETSIMIIYKTILIILIFNFLRNSISFLRYFSSVILFLFIIIIFNAFNETTEHLSSKMAIFLRFNLNIFIFLFFSNRIKYKADYYTRLRRLLNFNFYIITVSIFFGIFGIGRMTYEGSELGSKGFFEGGNDIGMAFLAISNFILYNAYLLKKNLIYRQLLIFVVLAIALATATKAIIIGSIISIIFIDNHFMKSNFIIKYLKGTIILSIMLLIVYQSALSSGLYERLCFFLDKHDIWFLIFSGRSDLALIIYQIFSKSDFIVQFFGVDKGVNIEMDFFDIIFNFGYFGFMFFMVLFILMLNKINKYKKLNHPFTSLLKFLFPFIIFIGLISGHTLFSTQGGLFLFIVTSLIFMEKFKLDAYGTKS
jgi:hypothetical protein